MRIISALLTHSAAAVIGGLIIFALMSHELGKLADINTPVGIVSCFPPNYFK